MDKKIGEKIRHSNRTDKKHWTEKSDIKLDRTKHQTKKSEIKIDRTKNIGHLNRSEKNQTKKIEQKKSHIQIDRTKYRTFK